MCIWDKRWAYQSDLRKGVLTKYASEWHFVYEFLWKIEFEKGGAWQRLVWERCVWNVVKGRNVCCLRDGTQQRSCVTKCTWQGVLYTLGQSWPACPRPACTGPPRPRNFMGRGSCCGFTGYNCWTSSYNKFQLTPHPKNFIFNSWIQESLCDDLASSPLPSMAGQCTECHSLSA